MGDRTGNVNRPEGSLPATDTDAESLALLADIDPTEAAELRAYMAARASHRERARAIARANEYLKHDGSGLFAHEGSARYNPTQKLWIVGYRDAARPDEILSGGGLIVPDDGAVYGTDSLPRQPELDGLMAFDIPGDWYDFVQEETDKPYWDLLERFVASERANPDLEIYPEPPDVFAAFERTPFREVRVVILGQDPYINPGEAHGLAFSVPVGIDIPPSLRIIRNELADDLGVELGELPEHGDLTGWAEQGVLLLNTSLTVRRGVSGSHSGRGWETFTDSVIGAISAELEGVVFILWGAHAQRRAKLIDRSRHPAPIKAAHPTAWATAHDPIAGSKPFTSANRLLAERGHPHINWLSLS